MTKHLEFFFDFGSPTSYLAARVLPSIAAECGAELVPRPMLLGGVFKATGNQSPAANAAKARWMDADIPRWAARHGVPYRRNPHFPINTLTLMRGAAGMQLRMPQRFDAYCDVVWDALWVEGRNLGDIAALTATLSAAGFDAEAFGALVADAAVKARLIETTEEAVRRGVFGAPALFVGDELFFGQDRLDFVREALARA